jgi:hypothetical protein
MLCCEKCFNDNYLKDIIKKRGHLDNCDFCGSTNVFCLYPSDLADIFLPLVELYNPVENFMPVDDLKEGYGDHLVVKLQDEWGIFAFYDMEKQQQLLEEMFSPSDPSDGYPLFLTSSVEREDSYWGTDNEISDMMRSQWRQFSDELKFNNRFFPNKEIDLERLSDLISFFTVEFKQNTHFYRARILPPDKKELFLSDMGKPPREKTRNGRANPKGISYLYLSSNDQTAISEVRPFIGAKIFVAQFIIKQDITLIDLRNPKINSPFKYEESLEYILHHIDFLRILGEELSKPIHPATEDIDYLPSQYLCELIKNDGYDGVCYKSSVASGFNIALFDDSKVKPVNLTECRIAAIKYDIQE